MLAPRPRGPREELAARNPFGHVRPVPVLRLPDGGVAVECAQVIGLAGLARLDPLAASSRGLGEVLRHFQSEPRSGSGWGQRHGGRRARMARAPAATDDGLLRRGDRPGGRRADLRTSERRAGSSTCRYSRPASWGSASPGAAHRRGGRVGGEAPLARRHAGGRRRAHARRARLRRRLPRLRRRRDWRRLPRRVHARGKAARGGGPPRPRPRAARARPFWSAWPGWERAAALFDEVSFEVDTA